MTRAIQKLAVRSLLMTAVSLLMFVAAKAQTNAAANITEFEVNGMKVLVKRRPGTPTVAAGLFFRGGVVNTNAANAGIEGFTLGAATEGSKSYPRQKLRKETTRVGTVITSGSNYDYSALSLACTKASFDDSWRIFIDVALNPAFAPEYVERVRDNILTALRSQSDTPEGQLETLSSDIVFAGHPYANDPQGTIESISKLKAADLIAYHRGLLQTSRLLLVVVGDVEPAELQKRVAAAFGQLPRGVYKDPVLPPVTFAKPSLEIAAKSIQTDYVKGTFAAPSIREPDYYAMRAAVTILQQQVFQEVRVRRNLSYAPDAGMDERAANSGAISVSSVNPNESVRVMLAEIERLRQGPVDAETIGQVSAFFLTTYYIKQETNAAQVAELAQYELIGGGWRNSLVFLDRIRKVTPAEVLAVANKYMTNLRFVVVGNAADVDKTIFLKK
ncbi:MAG: pitrilysin family protein [Pyrinomonadaceae bacterium]